MQKLNNTKMKDPFLSIVIPLYNESKRLHTLPEILEYFHRQSFKSEIILVNDGSDDDTLKKLRGFQLDNNSRIITYKQNRGKGYAIKTGMLASKGSYRLFMDIDLSTPIQEFEKFLAHLQNFHIVIGSRKLKASRLITRQPKLREHLGKAFTFFSQVVLELPLSDFTCGFKCFSKEAAEEIFSRQTIYRWGFDSEILFIGYRKGFSIKEIPVTWKNDINSKVKFPQDIISSANELMKIRINHTLGKYR